MARERGSEPRDVEVCVQGTLDDAPAPEETPPGYCPTPDNELLRVSPIALR